MGSLDNLDRTSQAVHQPIERTQSVQIWRLAEEPFLSKLDAVGPLFKLVRIINSPTNGYASLLKRWMGLHAIGRHPAERIEGEITTQKLLMQMDD